MRWLDVALTLCVGCDQLLQIDPDHLKHHDGPPPPCMATAPQDDFQSSIMTCEWGNQNGSATESLAVADGSMTITVHDTSFGGCTTKPLDLPANDTGMFIYAKTTLSTGDGYTVFKAIAMTTGDVSAGFAAANGHLGFYDGSKADTLIQKLDLNGDNYYWRLVRVAGGISADVSTDFITWTNLGTDTGSVGPVQLQFAAGGMPGTAVFQHFNTCPP